MQERCWQQQQEETGQGEEGPVPGDDGITPPGVLDHRISCPGADQGLTGKL